MRVLTLVKGLARGGAESLLVSSARWRDRDAFDHQVAYLTPANRDLVEDLRAAGDRVTCIGSDRWWDPRWLGRLRRVMGARGRDRIDVVHVHSPVPAIGARLVRLTLGRRRRPALLTTEHNVWASHHRVTRLFDGLTVGFDDGHLAVSDAVRRSMPARVRDHAEVVVHGVELDAVRSGADRVAARRELGIAGHEILVGTIANLRPQKGYPDLLRAARIVLDQTTDVRFVAVGKGPDEESVADLHRQLQLGDRFLLLGYRADAVRLLSGFDIFCLSSHHEGLPVAVMEALALGVPVVATAAGGTGELARDGVEGRIVPIGQPEALADALMEVAGDAELRAKLGAAAAATGDTLGIEGSVRRAEAAYRDLAKRGPR